MLNAESLRSIECSIPDNAEKNLSIQCSILGGEEHLKQAMSIECPWTPRGPPSRSNTHIQDQVKLRQNRSGASDPLSAFSDCHTSLLCGYCWEKLTRVDALTIRWRSTERSAWSRPRTNHRCPIQDHRQIYLYEKVYM